MSESEFVYGRQPVLEVLRTGRRTLHKIWIQDGTGGDIVREIERLARTQGVPVERARREHLDKRVQGRVHHQGIVAQASATRFLELDDFIRSLEDSSHSSFPVATGGESRQQSWIPGQRPPGMTTIIIALDEIQDPHNIGAILRSAGFFGVSAAIVPRWRSAPVGETAARVSSGAIEHVPLIRVTNLAESIKDLQAANFEVIGADMDGSSIHDHVPHRRSMIVLGSEGKGLRRLVRERCDKLLKIPGRGAVGSLNVSAAAAIFLEKFCNVNRHSSQRIDHTS
jgi:23S rRNA (guanosine2251-2'-O)-methyltransferase